MKHMAFREVTRGVVELEVTMSNLLSSYVLFYYIVILRGQGYTFEICSIFYRVSSKMGDQLCHQ